MRSIGERIAALDEGAAKLEEEFRDLLARIPNLPHESVPAGEEPEDNVEVKKWGEPRKFDFPVKAALGPGAGAGHSRLGARRENHRRAICRVLGPGREAGARA